MARRNAFARILGIFSQFKSTPGGKLDRDNDGIPCESLC
ncbi:excalibur calcium-binding domain-containing protein [Mesorhizobium sp. B3-1-3]|nr:excalibur calcium-binding domain-containing protein [Mesorhizobium sp. B3-1-8]TPI72283.1 excalibur calcium-binding domain-containing protein [Mesorhizobium sp. B3-1-3]